VQAQLRAHLASEKAKKMNLADAVPVIGDFINKKYKEVERAIERM